jgi:hypothetical protein
MDNADGEKKTALFTRFKNEDRSINTVSTTFSHNYILVHRIVCCYSLHVYGIYFIASFEQAFLYAFGTRRVIYRQKYSSKGINIMSFLCIAANNA